MNNQNSTITKTQCFYEKSYNPTNPVPVVIDNEFYIMLHKDVRNIIDTRFTCLTKCQPNVNNIFTQLFPQNVPTSCCTKSLGLGDNQQEMSILSLPQKQVTFLNYSKTTSTSDLCYYNGLPKENKEPGRCMCLENKYYKNTIDKCINTDDLINMDKKDLKTEMDNENILASNEHSEHVLIEAKKEIEDPQV